MKLKGIVLAVILSLASIMMPFNVYGDTISSSNVIGVNVELLGSTVLEHREDQGNNYYYKQYSYKAVIELDNSYVGVIGARVQGQYYEKAPVQGSQLLTQAFNYYRKIYVNGNSAEMTFVISTWYSSVQDPVNYRSDGTSPYVTIEDSNVTKFEDIDSIEQIINILLDIYQNSADIEGISTNQLTELQKIVSNTSLANDYLEDISKLRQYNIPIESLGVNYLLLHQLNPISINNYYYFQYPVFNFNGVSTLISSRYVNPASNQYMIYIIGINKDVTRSNVLNYLNFNTTPSIKSFTTLQSSLEFTIFKLEAYPSSYQRLNLTINDANSEFFFIYTGRNDDVRVSTDFALLNGLSNQLLDDLHIIANGTTQSNTAASDLESSNNQMADDMDDLATIESGYNQQFNNQLQEIDFSSPLQSNAGILPAANFVITIFNGLINNNPFSVLIIIVCILLIGKKVIGK